MRKAKFRIYDEAGLSLQNFFVPLSLERRGKPSIILVDEIRANGSTDLISK